MERNDENMQQEVGRDLTDTAPTSYGIGMDELSLLENRSGMSSSNRNGDANSSNGPQNPQLDGLLAETPKKRGRPPNTPAELRCNHIFFTLMSEEGRNVQRTVTNMNAE